MTDRARRGGNNKRRRPSWRPSAGLASTLEAMLNECTPNDNARAAALTAALDQLRAGEVAVLLNLPPLAPRPLDPAPIV